MANLLNTLINTIKHWYIPLVVGILFLALGIYIFTVPLETYVTLSILFSISFITSGLFEIFFSIQNSKALTGWGWYLVGGIFSLIMGVYLVNYPGISIVILPFIVGFTVMFRSFQLLGIAFDMKSLGILRWGNLAIASVLGIIFSFILLANPIFSGISIVTATALAFIFIGTALTILSFDLKNVKNMPNKISNTLKDKIANLQKEIIENTK